MSDKRMKEPTGPLSDDTIINLYWERNEEAIKATDEKYGRYLYTISYNILHDHFDSEECLNDTYLSTWNRIPPTRPNALQRFLSKITRDISVDRYRKEHSGRRIPSELMVSLEEITPCMEESIIEDEDEAVTRIGLVLDAYLQALPGRDRFLFVCRYYYADSVASIADMLEVSDKTVYRDLSRIREGLREALREEGIVL